MKVVNVKVMNVKLWGELPLFFVCVILALFSLLTSAIPSDGGFDYRIFTLLTISLVLLICNFIGLAAVFFYIDDFRKVYGLSDKCVGEFKKIKKELKGIIEWVLRPDNGLSKDLKIKISKLCSLLQDILPTVLNPYSLVSSKIEVELIGLVGYVFEQIQKYRNNELKIRVAKESLLINLLKEIISILNEVVVFIDHGDYSFSVSNKLVYEIDESNEKIMKVIRDLINKEAEFSPQQEEPKVEEKKEDAKEEIVITQIDDREEEIEDAEKEEIE